MREETPKAHFARLLRNAGHLFTGNAAGTAIGFVSLTLTARSVSTHEFGLLALISTYSAVVERLFNFQTWQAIVRFGDPGTDAQRRRAFAALVRFCLKLEAASLIFGFSLGCAGILLLSPWVDWVSENKPLLMIFLATLCVRFSGFSLGMHRAMQKFGAYAALTVAAAVCRLGAVVAAASWGRGFTAFFWAWIFGEVVQYLLVLASAIVLFGQRNFIASTDASDLNREGGLFDRSETMRFMSGTAAELFFRTIRAFDIPLVGILLGPAAAGIFTIAKRFAGVFTTALESSFHSIYAELSTIKAHCDAGSMWRLADRASLFFGLIALAVVLAFAIAGQYMVRLLFGPSYDQSFVSSLICLAGTATLGFVYPTWAALLAIGKVRVLAMGQAAVALANIAVLLLFAKHAIGNSAAWAYFAAQVAWAAWLYIGQRLARGAHVAAARA